MIRPLTEIRDHIIAELGEVGWVYIPAFRRVEDGEASLMALAEMLGEPLVTEDMDTSRPLLDTRADPRAPAWEPFNQTPAIGWHNDFSTWKYRPTISLAWLRAVPSARATRGNWRVVDCAAVVRHLEGSVRGRSALDVLQSGTFPFCYAAGEPVAFFRVFESRKPLQVRFYGRAMRLGLEICPVRGAKAAIEAWELAADTVGQCLVGMPGDLLVCDNNRAMHDRERQGPGRRSVLAFVT